MVPSEPESFEDRHLRALSAGFHGDEEGSLAAVQALVDERPDHELARYDLAMIQMMLGMYEEACANLRRLLEINPNFERARVQMSFC